MMVHPDFQRRGIGTALLHAVEDWSRERQAESLELNVWEANRPGARFYRAHGLNVEFSRMAKRL